MLPGTHLSRAIARSGFDWILVDCEHGNISGKHPFRALLERQKAVFLNYEPQHFRPSS